MYPLQMSPLLYPKLAKKLKQVLKRVFLLCVLFFPCISTGIIYMCIRIQVLYIYMYICRICLLVPATVLAAVISLNSISFFYSSSLFSPGFAGYKMKVDLFTISILSGSILLFSFHVHCKFPFYDYRMPFSQVYLPKTS